MKKILFFIFLFGVLFVGSVVNADTYTNIYVPNWTYGNNSLTVLQNYGGILGMTQVIKSPQTITFDSNVSFSREPYLARFRVVFDTNTYIKTDVSYSNCNSEYGYCYTANMNSDTTPISLSFSMNQEGLVTYCSVASGGEVGGFVVDCPISHKTKPITKLIIEVVGGDLTGFVATFGIGRTVTFVYPDSENIITSIDSLKSDMNSKLNTINSTLGTVNTTIGGLPQGIYNKFDNILQEIKNNQNANKTVIENQMRVDMLNHQESIEANNKNTNKAISAVEESTQKTVEATNQNTNAISNMNSTISDSSVNVDGSFFSGFDNNTHGLTAIITSPLQLIGSITSSTCSPLGIPMPFGLPSAQLPCMKEIYQTYFGSFFTLYQTLTFGLISYWVCVQTFAMVKGFKDPDSDRIEVLDL